MTTREQIARDLAAVLSPGGETDWRRYLEMAKEVETRLDQQFEAIMSRRAGICSPLHSGEFERQKRSCSLSSDKEKQP